MLAAKVIFAQVTNALKIVVIHWSILEKMYLSDEIFAEVDNATKNVVIL